VTDDPAEAAADRAADAVLAGDQIAMASAMPALRRTCTPAPGRAADERGLRSRVRQSRSFELTLSGAPTIDSTGTVTQINVTLGLVINDLGGGSIGGQYTPPSGGLPGSGGITLTIPHDLLGGGSTTPRPRIPTIDCSGTGPPRTTYSYACEQITPGTPARPPVTRSARTRVYALFR
jgi:hypothetical protein